MTTLALDKKAQALEAFKEYAATRGTSKQLGQDRFEKTINNYLSGDNITSHSSGYKNYLATAHPELFNRISDIIGRTRKSLANKAISNVATTQVNYIHNHPSYAKGQAWAESVKIPYELYSNRKSLPADKQYITLSGHCVNNGDIIGNSELDRVLSSKLATPNQFYGVEIASHIYRQNLAYRKAHWIEGNIAKFVGQLAIEGDLNPGIINADFTHTAEVEANNVMAIIRAVEVANVHNVLISFNFAYEGRKIKTKGLKGLIAESGFKFGKNWSVDFDCMDTTTRKIGMKASVLWRK